MGNDNVNVCNKSSKKTLNFSNTTVTYFITHPTNSFRFRTERMQLLCRNNELMRKLRNLWCSHKKYCTTTVLPLRSYTPLSGYPNSRSSYDLDRTYYTSTPYTNRFRRPESRFSHDLGNLSRCLSDLSIDRIDDSDDDPAKVSGLKIKELELLAW